MRKIFYLAIAGLIAATLSCGKSKDAGVIKIGIIGPMKFVQGKAHWNGALMAQKEINDAGGWEVGGKKMKIELVKADSNEFLSMTDATNAMERLVTQDKVDFLIGGFRSEAVLAMQEIAMDAKTIFIGVGAAHPEICLRVGKNYKRYKYFFRLSPFNSKLLGKTAFIQIGTIAAILRKTLGLKKINVALVAEKAMWTQGMVKAAKVFLPKMKLNLVGVWQPSPTATDVTAELNAIQRKNVHIIFTVFSSSVGITFAKQAGELKIPAVQAGINVEAQKDGFWEATNKKGNYVSTMTTYSANMEITPLTLPFIQGYKKMFGETPPYTADVHTAIRIVLESAIKKANSIDPEKLIPIMEKAVLIGPGGKLKWDKNHDVIWGPGFLTSTAAQWQDGKLMGFWPNKWVAAKGAPPVTYKGVVPYKIPPWMIKKYKK